jgi:hypothetical protein
MLVKWVMISTGCPKISVKRVASGLAGFTVHDVPPIGEGRQVYPCEPNAWPTRNAEFPAGGVISVGVGGGVTVCAEA